MQTNKIAHRKLTVTRCVNHILQTRCLDEQMPPVGEQLMIDQGMPSLELLTKVGHGSSNLLQLDLVLAAQRVQDMRFGEVAERQPGVRRIRKFDYRLGSPACARP
jgi:hypothetical protein